MSPILSFVLRLFLALSLQIGCDLLQLKDVILQTRGVVNLFRLLPTHLVREERRHLGSIHVIGLIYIFKAERGWVDVLIGLRVGWQSEVRSEVSVMIYEPLRLSG